MVIGRAPCMARLRQSIEAVAGTDADVLVLGETGTGKELVARCVHDLSARKHAPFVAVNCGAVPESIIESELFGHVKGAFTGAHASREGLFTCAEGGTMFLDEIGEMPLPMQAKLLRVLEEKRVRPVGADREVPVNARVLAATNRRLRDRVADGAFREDLFFRLNVMAIRVPSLRERIEDVPLLAEHFIRILAPELGVAPVPLSHHDVEMLRSYHWP